MQGRPGSRPRWSARRTLLKDEERDVLESLRVQMSRIGSANDAQDHGCEAEAVLLRRDATAGIQDLLRRHAFLAELYPSLGSELGTRRLEDCGWSRLVDDVERRLQFVHVDLVPWHRVVHFGGRATDVSDWIAELTRESHARAEERLRECLVRDGRLAQATPLALRLLLGAVRFGLLRDPTAVQEIVGHVADAARLRLEGAVDRRTPSSRADWSVYREDRLWPPFQDEARDAALWQAWRPSEEQTLRWAELVAWLLEEHDRLVAARER